MKPIKSYGLVAQSIILRGEKANKGIVALPSENPHQMNRVRGFLDNGVEVLVAQRPGKGGMDFTKLLGGKVFAVAADGASPVFEKKDNKATNIQKTEDGLPLYSSSGFYSLSSKEYPALDLMKAYTLLQNKGNTLLMITPAQLEAVCHGELTSSDDWDLLEIELEAALTDDYNLVAQYDEATNLKRKRGIGRAQQDAEDNSEQYTGAEFKELQVSKKDGNAFVLLTWKSTTGATGSSMILRQKDLVDSGDSSRVITQYLTEIEAMESFQASDEFKSMMAEVSKGNTVQLHWVQGHAMRTSVSFRRKVENVMAVPADKPQYGDAVYILAALKNWTQGLITVMQSQHPNFPQADYSAHHYVVASRQAEVGMDKLGEKWTAPQALSYDLVGFLNG